MRHFMHTTLFSEVFVPLPTLFCRTGAGRAVQMGRSAVHSHFGSTGTVSDMWIRCTFRVRN